jgi:hypothetical protein
MKKKKILLYSLFTTAIIAAIVFNIKIGNTYPVANLLLFNLEALSNESSPGESGSSGKIKCDQKYKTEQDPLNKYTCGGGTLYSNHDITLYQYYCDEGANTSDGCRKGTVKKGHDCNNQYCQTIEEVYAQKAQLPCTSKCPAAR